MCKALGLIPSSRTGKKQRSLPLIPSWLDCTYLPSQHSVEAEAGRLWVWGHLGLHSKCEANLGYTETVWLKKEKRSMLIPITYYLHDIKSINSILHGNSPTWHGKQSVKCLLYKHESLSSNFRTQKKPVMVAHGAIPVLRRSRQREACRPVYLLHEHQASERLCFETLRAPEERYPS